MAMYARRRSTPGSKVFTVALWMSLPKDTEGQRVDARGALQGLKHPIAGVVGGYKKSPGAQLD